MATGRPSYRGPSSARWRQDMNIVKFCPLSLSVREYHISVYIRILFLLSLSCAVGSATSGSTTSRGKGDSGHVGSRFRPEAIFHFPRTSAPAPIPILNNGHVPMAKLKLPLAWPATEVQDSRTQKSAWGGAWGRAGPKRGAREMSPEGSLEGACEGAQESACHPLLSARRTGRAPSEAPSRAPSQRPVLPQALR